jgi:parallel beta-helix repeat protein
MKKFFVLLFGLIILILIGGCQNLVNILPFLNRAPVIISEPIITAKEDQLYSYQIEASDPDGDNLNYSLIIKPEGMSINTEKNGLITWMPTNNQVGIHQVIVEISDGKYKVQQIFEIEVINVNNPPQILSYFPVNLNIEINEGDSVKFEIQGTDVDLNTTLDYRWFLEGESISNSFGIGSASKSTWKYFSEYGDCGIKIAKVLVSDGEFEDSVQWKITIKDITPPNQPILNNVTSPTNVSLQILTGAKETNSSIWINGTEAVPLNSSIDWSYSYNLSEGTNNISVTSCDAAGNESSAVTIIIILDTINQAAPTLDAVLSPTNVSPQTLSGTKETNTSVWINNIEIIPVNPSTTWTYDFYLSEGENNISITCQDSAGNESDEASTKIILDTISPAVSTLNEVITPTNISIQILSGNKEASSSIWLNGTEVISHNLSTDWSYSYNLSEGTNNISISSLDTAGNENTAVIANIILDTIKPEAPTLNAVISPTNISSQALVGTKEVDSSILINSIEVIPINSSIVWSYCLDLSEGINSITITSKDNLGNESSVVIEEIEYDLNTYVNAGNTSGIEDGTETHPFNTIAEGIVKVPPGKSVIVAAGTYNEKLIINKGIVLQGAGKEFTFINGLGYAGNLITIEANNVTISGFTIDSNNSASVGIYFNNYSFISINNNIIQNNTSYGINYSNSSPTIENNNIKNNNYSGIEIATGGAGIIKNNSIVSNQYGIRTCGDSSPKISYNDISNNSNTGIYCRESATPVIYYNTINNNSYCGILIDNVLENVVNPDIGNEYPSGESSPGRNKITGNTNYGIRNKTNHPIKAEKNWWGDVAGPKWSGNNTTTGDRVYWDNANGIIDFYPWLSAAP